MPVSPGFRAPNAAGLHRPGLRAGDNGHPRAASQSIRSATDAYRDQARRLRQQFAHQPGQLQSNLSALSRKYDRANPIVRSVGKAADVSGIDHANAWAHARPEPRDAFLEDAPVQKTPLRSAPRIYAVPTSESPDTPFARAVVDWFADQVTRSFSGQLLHHSQRRSLLKTAERLGIDRFHANLIIAVAQHDAAARPQARFRMYPTRSRFSYVTAAVVVLIQGAIVWGAWHILHGV